MSAARPYDLTQQSEIDRLIFELQGYMLIGLKHGTDFKGRQFAYDALKAIKPGDLVKKATAP